MVRKIWLNAVQKPDMISRNRANRQLPQYMRLASGWRLGTFGRPLPAGSDEVVSKIGHEPHHNEADADWPRKPTEFEAGEHQGDENREDGDEETQIPQDLNAVVKHLA